MLVYSSFYLKAGTTENPYFRVIYKIIVSVSLQLLRNLQQYHQF